MGSFGHTCIHADGRSHLCPCKLSNSHGAVVMSCTKYKNVVKDQEINGRFVNEVHNYRPKPNGAIEVCADCDNSLENRLHPHVYTEAPDFRRICVCGSTTRALIHQMTSI